MLELAVGHKPVEITYQPANARLDMNQAILEFTGKDGRLFYVLRDDKNLTPKALKSGSIIIEQELLSLNVIQNLRKDDVVIDVGAFIGDTTRFFLDKGCRVFAFEPQKDAFDCLVLNCPEAYVFDKPVGSGEKVVANQNPINGNLGTRTTSKSEVGIESFSIDSLCLNKCALLKIDVEGYEPAVLDGANETIKKCRPIIVVEVYDTLLQRAGFNRQDVVKRLLNLGYSIQVAVGFEYDDRVDYLALPANK